MLIAKLFANTKSFSKNNGLVRISGVCKGTIEKGKEVVITPSGRFYGKIEAKEVKIAGLMDGDVLAKNLVMYPSGQLYFGELNCQHVSIKNGGIMVDKEEKGQKKTAKESSLHATELASQPNHGEKGTTASQTGSLLPDGDETNKQPMHSSIHAENNIPLDDQEAIQLQPSGRKLCGQHKQPHFLSSY